MAIGDILSLTKRDSIPNAATAQLFRVLLPAGTIDGVKIDLEGANASSNVVFGFAVDGVAQYTTELTITSGTNEITTTGLAKVVTNDNWGTISIESPFTSGALNSVVAIGAHIIYETQTVNLTGTQTIGGAKTFSSDVIVPDEAYDATAWNGSLEVPTKNAIRDKIEALGGGVSDGDKGDITVSSSGTVWTVDNDAITYAKMQNVSATSRVLGRITAGAGDTEELTGSNVRTIAGLATSDSPEFAAVNIGAATDTTVTRVSAGVIAVEGATVYTQGGALGTPASGTLTNCTGLPTAGLVNDAVTLAKIQNATANSKLLGSGSAGSGADYAEITLGTNLSMSGTTLNATGGSADFDTILTNNDEVLSHLGNVLTN